MAFWDNTRSGGQSSGGGGGMYRQSGGTRGTFTGALQRPPMSASGPMAVARMGGAQRPSPASNQPVSGPGYATNIGLVQPRPRTAPQAPVQQVARPPMQAMPAPAPTAPAPKAVQGGSVVTTPPAASPMPRPGEDKNVAPPPPPGDRPPVYDAPQQGDVARGGVPETVSTQPWRGEQAQPAPVSAGTVPGLPGDESLRYPPQQGEMSILPAAQQFGKAR